MSNSLWPHGLEHTRLPCPPLSSRVFSNWGLRIQIWILRRHNSVYKKKWKSKELLDSGCLESIHKGKRVLGHRLDMFWHLSMRKAMSCQGIRACPVSKKMMWCDLRSRKVSQDVHAVDWNREARPSRKARHMRWAGDKPRQHEMGKKGRGLSTNSQA